MAPRRAVSRKVLLESLEKRLDLLARTLDGAEIAEKSVEIVKEIKELHALLRAMREPRTAAVQRLVVVWGGPEQQGASSAGPARLAAPLLSAQASSSLVRRPAKGGAALTTASAGQKAHFLPGDLQAQDKAEPATSARPQESAHQTTGPTPRN